MGKKTLRVYCSSVAIQEEGQGLTKTYMDIEATLEHGVLYVDSKYRFRMKQMTELEMAADEISTKFENKGKTTSVYLEASSQSGDWQDFCRRWNAHFEKKQSKERKSGFGGGRGSLKRFGRQKENMPWDEEKIRRKLSKTSQPMTQTSLTKRSAAVIVSSQKEERPYTPLNDAVLSESNSQFQSQDAMENDELVGTDDQEENHVAPMESDDESVPKVLKKKRRIQRKAIFDDDDSDDDIFASENPFTTPAASNHVVSPATATMKDTLDDDSSDIENKHDDLLKNQPQISSFFAHAKPKQVLTPKATTPTKSPEPQSTARKAIFSSAGKYGVSQRSLDMVNATQRKNKPSLDNNSWLMNSQSKKGLSSAEKRRPLFAPSPKELASDPIEDNATPLLPTTPNSPKRWRNSMLTNHRRRQFGKGAKTFANHRPSLPERMDFNEPELPRFRGLRNLGNTCYMNSSLQMLFTCREFMTALGKSTGGELVQSVCGIYRELQQPNAMAARPTVIKDAIDKKTDKFLGFEQRDAHEFLADLIDHMDEELKGSQGESDGATTLPTDDFSLTVRAHLTCTSCGYTR